MKQGVFFMTVLLFVSGAAMAQKVVTTTDNRVIIDCRAMPAGAISKEKKARTTDGENEKLGTNDLNNLGSVENNKTVSQYFEVAKSNVSTSGMDWLSAVNSCAGVADDGKGLWRLPTQRELMLIWTLHETLKSFGLQAFNANFYWSATEYNNLLSWPISFNNGQAGTDAKSSTIWDVRCIRDLTPPAK